MLAKYAGAMSVCLLITGIARAQEQPVKLSIDEAIKRSEMSGAPILAVAGTKT